MGKLTLLSASREPRPEARRGRLLLVDDDRGLSRLLQLHLQREGYEVLWAPGAEEGLKLAERMKPALVILDVRMPGMSGLEFLKRLRSDDQVPVLLLTAQRSDVTQILGFELGADDYVNKPVCAEALSARIAAILKRRTPKAPADAVLRVGALTVDVRQRVARVGGEALELTTKEFDVLRTLTESLGKVLTRNELLQQIWGYSPETDLETRTVDQHVARVRHKLGPEGKRIVTVTHYGYRMVPD